MNKIPPPINRFSCFILSLKNNIQLRIPLLVLLIPIALYGCSDSPTSTPPTPKPIPVFESDGIAEKAADMLGMKMRYGKPQLAFNTQGDGMAVWTAETGKGLMLMYSIFDASTQIWSKEEVVANLPYKDNNGYVQNNKSIIASDGTSFGVVWQFENQVYVKMYNMGNSAQWSAATQVSQISQQTVSDVEASIAAIPSKGYAVAWRTRTDVFITRFNGQNLDNTPYELFGKAVPLPGGQAFPPGRILLSYVLLPILDQFAVLSGYGTRLRDSLSILTPNVLFRSYNSSLSTWSVTKIINDPSIKGRLSHLAAISGVNGAAITWTLLPDSAVDSSELSLFANILHTGALWDLPVQLGTTDRAQTLAKSFDFSAANNSYGFIWKRTVYTDTTTSTVFTNIYSETSKTWATPTESIPFSGRTDVNIANNGSTYVATYINQSNGPSISLSAIMASETDPLLKWSAPLEINQSKNLNINEGSEIVSNGTDFVSVAVALPQLSATTLSLETNVISVANGSLDILAKDSLLVEGVENWDLTNVGDRLWFLGGQYLGHKPTQNNNPPVVTNFNNTSQNWNSPTYLIQDNVLTSAVFPRMISNDKANSMLTWYQFNRGKYDIYTNFRIDGKWNDPVFINSTSLHNYSDISSYFSPYYPYLDRFPYYATAVYNDQFVILWFDRKGLYARTFDNGINGNVETLVLTDNAIVSRLFQLSMTKTDAGLKACWAYYGTDIGLNYACKTYENQKWSASTETFSPITTEQINESKLAVNRRGDIGITWTERKAGTTGGLFDIYAQVKKNGVLNDIKQLNDVASTRVDLVNAVFDSDNNLAIAWRQTNIDPDTQRLNRKTYVSIFDNNQVWVNHDRRIISNSESVFASNMSGFALARYVFDTIYLDIYENGIWSQSEISLLPYDTARPVNYNLEGKNGTYAIYWAQLNNNENASYNIYASTFDSVTKPTEPTPILSLPAVNPASRLEPNLSSYRDGFALTWSEFDSVEDPATSKIWTKMGDIFTK